MERDGTNQILQTNKHLGCADMEMGFAFGPAGGRGID